LTGRTRRIAGETATGGQRPHGFAGLAQAALKADAVTGDPSWDTYCSYIQRAIDVAKQQRAAQMAILTSPAMVNDEKITAARHSIFQMDERIRSLEWVVNMPARSNGWVRSPKKSWPRWTFKRTRGRKYPMLLENAASIRALVRSNSVLPPTLETGDPAHG
jgi:hypothetical protein